MLAVLVSLLAGLLTTGQAPAQTGVEDLTARLERATVFLMQTYTEGGTQIRSCVGTGTLISADGLILTNAHLALPIGACRGDSLVVALPVRLNEPPIPIYLARVVQADLYRDVAVLQITSALDGSRVEPSLLNLPFVQIGDPSTILPGNTLTLVGYPDAGGASIAAISGMVTGITAERGGGRASWFRTDADLGGTMSGGGAYDPSGFLVGIPTSSPGTDGSAAGPTCLSIQDSNGDLEIDALDPCVPIGAPITQIRPVSFAAPLIEAARSGFRLAHRSPLIQSIPAAQPTISRLFFSTGITEAWLPSQIISAAPTGTSSLYVFFDYAEMRPGTPYELVVTNNGLKMPQFSLGPLAWSGDRSGTWYIGTENLTWPDGNYEFTVLINGEPAATGAIVIGGAPAEPTFSNLRFGIPDAAGGFAASGTLLPTQITQIDAQFDYSGLSPGQLWTEIWYLDGSEVSRAERTWDLEAAGQTRVSAINYSGLPLGTYRLDLLIGNRLAATGDVTLAGNTGAQSLPAVFSNARVTSGISRDGLPDGQAGPTLPLGTRTLYTFVDFDLMPADLLWTYRWYLDGRLVASSTQPWGAGSVGEDFWVSLVSDSPLPEGSYAVEVLVEDLPMFSVNVSIGSGTQPITGIEVAGDEVLISGTVLDAMTAKGIPGALVIVLDVTLESPQFTWNEAEIHTQAITDERGRFTLPRGLPRGNFYTVFVFADGYITVLEDNFVILRNQPSPADITIEMARP